MLSYEATKRFSNIQAHIVMQHAISYPMILPGKEVFFTYECTEGICPLEIFCRDLRTNEVMRKDFLEVYPVETISECLKKTMSDSKLKGAEAFDAEEKLLEIYEKIWENYYTTEDAEKLELQEEWKHLFEELVGTGSLYELYFLVGKEMFEK